MKFSKYSGESHKNILAYDPNIIKSITPKTEEQYAAILNFMEDRQWHKTSEIMVLLSLKETRAKQLMKELTAADMLVDNGKNKGRLYKLK